MGILMKQGPLHVHFVGIGGIGMSGIARLLVEMGWRVSGSDLTDSFKTTTLAALGIDVHIGHQAQNATGADLVVFSSAVPPENCEVVFARQEGIPVIARAEMLGRLMEDKYGIAVAGSHGKTTTTSMIALLLERLGCDPSVVVGGETMDIGGNCKLGKGPYLVVEADESDGSFLRLSPSLAVVTNIDADHLDHYADLEAIRAAFLEFMKKIDPSGLVVICADDHGLTELAKEIGCKQVSYGLEQAAAWQATGLQFHPYGSESVVHRRHEPIGCLELQVPGKHNIANALAALAVADELGLPIDAALIALSQFRGVHRRFEVVGESHGVLVIDDYAHHPTEIRATLAAARHLNRRVIVVFQPHRYTRLARLLEDFATCFQGSDELIVTDVYGAGEKAIPGITGEVLTAAIRDRGCPPQVEYVPDKRDIPEVLERTVVNGDVVLTMGAGDIRDAGEAFLDRWEG